MNTQTTQQKMSAHITSTADMLMEVFEAQKIPAEVAVVAMVEAILRTNAYKCEQK